MQTRDVLPTVVLGCAKQDRLVVPPMLEGLIAAGFEVEVASGLETRGDPLVNAADPLLGSAARMREAAYVLLVSTQLPALMAEQLRQRLIAASVPPRRIITIQIDEGNGAIDVAQRLAAVGIVASHVRRPTSVRLGAVRGASEGSGARPTTMVGVAPNVPIQTVPPPPLPPPMRVAQPLHVPVSGSVPVLDVEIEDDMRPKRRRVLAIAGAAAGALALVVMIAARSSGPAATADDTAAVKVKEQWLALYERARGQLAPQPVTQAPLPPVAVASPIIVPVPVPAPAPTVQPEVVIAVPEEPAPIVADVPPAPIVEDGVAPDAAHVDEVEIQSIYAGLVGQKFRALDIVLVSPEPRKRKGKRVYKTPAKLAWASAKGYCEKLEIDGVGDWRLPRVGELGSLSAGELLSDGKFWSQTEGDTFGRTRIVWNTKTAKMGTAPVRWKGGRVVCVRTLAKAPALPPKQ